MSVYISFYPSIYPTYGVGSVAEALFTSVVCTIDVGVFGAEGQAKME